MRRAATGRGGGGVFVFGKWTDHRDREDEHDKVDAGGFARPVTQDAGKNAACEEAVTVREIWGMEV
jgi:hypothetical protein